MCENLDLIPRGRLLPLEPIPLLVCYPHRPSSSRDKYRQGESSRGSGNRRRRRRRRRRRKAERKKKKSRKEDEKEKEKKE